VIGCKSAGVCAVFDPQGRPEAYTGLAAGNGLKITHVFETHVQADHVSVAPELARIIGAELCFGPGSGVRFPHRALTDGDALKVGNREIRVMHTPGHTEEHVCYYIDEWFVLTGDTLLVGDVGRVDLTASDHTAPTLEARAQTLYASVQKVLVLPEWTEVFPGHYSGSVCGKGLDGKPMSTIGRERRRSRALKLSPEEFVRYSVENLPPPPEDFQKIKKVNLGID